MTAFDLLKAFYNRNFYRFTGPPENWLTAIKYMTWGLEEKYLDRWKQIRSGDVFLMHSTVESQFYKKPVSSVLGLGVVGGQFKMKDNFLWIQEIQGQVNRWPLLVPFSEVYLFSEMPESATWEAPGIGTAEQISPLIAQLLKNAIPIKTLGENKFPVMGSWSSVRNEVVDQIFSKGEPILYDEFYRENQGPEQPSEFFGVKVAEEGMRYIPSLKFLDGSRVKIRRPSQEVSAFERDNALLERAEENHAEVLQAAIDFFHNKGFDTWNNQHVDLLAESEDQAFLIEVKSTLNHNFRSQARRAVGQLFEYEHFDVRQYLEKKSKPIQISKLLMVTNDPTDQEYGSFLNTLKIQLGWPQGTRISTSGSAAGLIVSNQ